MKGNLAVTLILISLLYSCRSAQLAKEISIEKSGPPPGTVKIGKNLYIDQMEIRNVDYLEFMHWMKKVYGSASQEYRAIRPDTVFWRDLSADYAFLDSSYLYQPAFRKLAVLGVSNEQARQYVKWRSDRVMEFFLIRLGAIEYQENVQRDEVFTIENYFTGQYLNTPPSRHVAYYPEYRLVNADEDTRSGFKTICTFKRWEGSEISR